VLEPGDIHHREISMEFATRSEVVNRITATIAYRWYAKNTYSDSTGFSIPTRNGLPEPGYAWPSKDSLLSRKGGFMGPWRVTGVMTTSPPPSGWYKSDVFDTSPTAWIIDEATRETYAVAATIVLAKWVSQAQRETYELTISAPQSIDQFGEIDGQEMRFALESEIDPGVFEEFGCSVGPDDDRRADLEEAIQAIQAMARKQIAAGHRANLAAFRYKPKTGRAGAGTLLPVEIGEVLRVSSDEVTVTGFVTEFTHTQAANGDRYTDIKLAVSRVDSALSVTEDWTLPVAPTQFALNPKSLEQPTLNPCSRYDEATEDFNFPDLPDNIIRKSSADIDEGGTMTFTTPSLAKDKTDELVATVEHAYEMAIPVDQFDVEVP